VYEPTLTTQHGSRTMNKLCSKFLDFLLAYTL